MTRVTTAPALQDKIQRHLAELAATAAARARELCPVDTGRLRDSIVSAGPRYGSGLDYAAAIEFGTSKAPARPFLRPALNALKH